MSGIGPYKLSDAVKPPRGSKNRGGGGKPATTPGERAEQAREAHEREAAKNATGSARDRMVEVGRGNQQAGRQSSGHGG
jgi:hypothetical protein